MLEKHTLWTYVKEVLKKDPEVELRFIEYQEAWASWLSYEGFEAAHSQNIFSMKEVHI